MSSRRIHAAALFMLLCFQLDLVSCYKIELEIARFVTLYFHNHLQKICAAKRKITTFTKNEGGTLDEDGIGVKLGKTQNHLSMCYQCDVEVDLKKMKVSKCNLTRSC